MNRNLRLSKFAARAFLALGAIVALTVYVLASSGGKTNRTGPTNGCTCHAASPSAQTTVEAVSETGNFSVKTGETINITVSVSNPSKSFAGVNIAVKSSETGEVNAGILSAGDGLQFASGELTHTSPMPINSGKAEFSFAWTAPSEPGTYYLRAVGNAIDDNGGTSGDAWNRMPVQVITVSNAVSVDENDESKVAFRAYSSIDGGSFTLLFNSSEGRDARYAVYDVNGARVFISENIKTRDGENSAVWRAIDSKGLKLNAGVYFIALIGPNGAMGTEKILVR